MTGLLEGGILSPKDTYKLTSLSGATIWRLRRQGQFPEPIRLSPGRMGWRRADIEQWLSERQAVHGRMRPSPHPRATTPAIVRPPLVSSQRRGDR
jgi:prophage regulatory protein